MIADMGQTGKPAWPVGRGLLNTLLIPAIVVWVGIAAFGLGRLSALKEAKTSVIIHPAPTGQTP